MFRVCVISSLAAVLGGGLFLYGCWAATDFDPEAGRQFRYNGTLLVVVLGVAVQMYYPWSLRWVRANGCRPDVTPGTSSGDGA